MTKAKSERFQGSYDTGEKYQVRTIRVKTGQQRTNYPQHGQALAKRTQVVVVYFLFEASETMFITFERFSHAFDEAGFIRT